VVHVLVDEAVPGQHRPELLALGEARQLAVDEQVRDLDEVRLLRELLDAVAAVAQDALFTVEVRDRARRRPGVHVPAVERDVAGLVAQRSDVDRVLILRPDDHGEIDLLAVGEDQLCTRFLVRDCHGRTIPDLGCDEPLARSQNGARRASDRRWSNVCGGARTACARPARGAATGA
jgi:hypothetical protein